ncbi:MAG: hypothetical protein IIY21_25115 [Clostridiales bacterium]|nr:hypothetical protein [Clostridiales bacterium]MBQ1575048.1 hypothetical protein [Clostridiales bacterium]
MSKRIDKRKLSEAIRRAEDMNVDYRGLTEEEVENLDDAITEVFDAARFLLEQLKEEE